MQRAVTDRPSDPRPPPPRCLPPSKTRRHPVVYTQTSTVDEEDETGLMKPRAHVYYGQPFLVRKFFDVLDGASTDLRAL